MSDVVLYILMRRDVRTMNAGKMAAQASHAANQAVFEAGQSSFNRSHVEWTGLVEEWQAQTGKGFGTCIVLAVYDYTAMHNRIYMARSRGLHANIVTDPTYPHMLPPWRELSFKTILAVILFLSAVLFFSTLIAATSYWENATLSLGILAVTFHKLICMHRRAKYDYVESKETCGYILCRKPAAGGAVEGLKLHP